MEQAGGWPQVRRFGRYETLFRIATGGMAEVYAARLIGEAGFQKLVAIKRMHPHLAIDEQFVAMFLDEARLAANIESPHVVSTIDLGRAGDGSLYIVMELVRGVTLSTLARNAAKAGKSLPVPVAVEIMAQAALGLQDAHDATTPNGAPLEIVHRDISPQNIIVGVDGHARVMDFGVARAILRWANTQSGQLKGKAGYFSPEAVMGLPLDHRSDIFSLGVVAWEVLAGQRLFKAESFVAILEQVRSMPIPALCALRPDVPSTISLVVSLALERDLEQRVQSSADLASALRSAAQSEMELPDARALAQFVREHGGEELQRMFAGIDVALAEEQTTPSRPRDSHTVEGDAPAYGVSFARSRVLSSRPPPAPSASAPDAAGGVATTPSSRSSASTSGAPAPRSSKAPGELAQKLRMPLVRAALGFVLLFGGVAFGTWIGVAAEEVQPEGEARPRSGAPPSRSASASAREPAADHATPVAPSALPAGERPPVSTPRAQRRAAGPSGASTRAPAQPDAPAGDPSIFSTRDPSKRDPEGAVPASTSVSSRAGSARSRRAGTPATGDEIRERR